MNPSDLIDRIEKLLEELEALTPKWAKAKADFNFSNEFKKATLNTIKSASDKKTATEREQEAYASKEYEAYLWKAFKVDCEYYSLEGKKNLIETELDSLRSRLSYEKFMIEKTM